MKKYIFFLFLFPSLLFAQNNGDSLKFEIIKSSINFLSTDKVSFPESSGKASKCKNGDYNCLKKYCDDNKLLKANDKIEKWGKMPSGSKGDLANISQSILDELTTGGNRDKRTKLQTFKTYKESLSKLIASFAETVPQEKAEDNEPNINEPANDVVPAVVIKTETDDAGKPNSLLPLIALILSLISLGISALVLIKSKGDSTVKGKNTSDFFVLKEDLRDLSNRLNQRPIIDTRPLDERIKNLENKFVNFENQSRTIDLVVEKKVVAPNQVNNQTQVLQNLYAKLPDTGSGFSQSIISNTQNGEQIYDLEIRGDKGTFSVSGDASAQKYALSDFNYYLSNACEFLNQPAKNCRIHTQEKGTIIRSGSNWLIQNKAKIEFK